MAKRTETVYVEVPVGMTADKAIKDSTKFLKDQGYKESYRGTPYKEHEKTVVQVTFTKDVHK